MTSPEREVLRALQEAGPEGLTNAELRAAGIVSPDMVVGRLRLLGHAIGATPEWNQWRVAFVRRYVLAPDDPQESLFGKDGA